MTGCAYKGLDEGDVYAGVPVGMHTRNNVSV
jgi:hypothetical protein